jgi:putative ABC transport system permease protein
VAQWQLVSGRTFSTLGIAILQGRAISDSDAAGSPEVAVVSKQFVNRYLPGEDPIGKRIRILDGELFSIVGVAADSRQDSIERRPRAVIYRPYQQAPPRSAYFAVNAGQNPGQFASVVRAVIHRIDPVLPVAEMQSFGRVVSNAMVGFNHISVMLTTVGVVALFLAVLGVYSLMAYTVGERTREIGIRMALGATARQVLLMVLRRGSILAGAGLALGLAGAFAVARMLAQVLYGVSAADAFVFTVVPAVLALSLAFACLLPARSAASTNPIVALREE